jgi:succinoglycan biosynthesis protein ExoA
MPLEIYNKRPLVSVVLATFNERRHVQKCVDSLLTQETSGFDMEILAVDGGSTDGTREYLETVAGKEPGVRVLSNEKRRAPFAFNIGLREAKGDFVCIFGSHTIYKNNYIAVCLKELIANGAGGCGGRVITEPSSDNLQARLVAHGMAHPFGSSRKSFRTQAEGFADTVNYMVIRKDAMLKVGGYSEALLRNQDNDFNQKLCANGYRLFYTWKTQCIYHPKETVKDLFRYGYGNGYWNLISFKVNSTSMGLYHFVPFFFVSAVLASLLLSIAGLLSLNPGFRFLVWSLPTLLVLHLGLGTFAALQVLVRNKFLGAVWLPFIFFGFHIAYGLGTLMALLTGASIPKSPFKAEPQPASRVRL